jgi:putative transcription antitermination factor YqgF
MTSKISGKTVLAIDYGTRHIGLAIETIAGPMLLPSLDQKKQKWQAAIGEIIKQHEVEKIVVGGEGVQKQILTDFIDLVKTQYALPVKIVDESMTSQWAEGVLSEAGSTRRNIKKQGHSVAAYKLLVAHLESKLIQN